MIFLRSFENVALGYAIAAKRECFSRRSVGGSYNGVRLMQLLLFRLLPSAIVYIND